MVPEKIAGYEVEKAAVEFELEAGWPFGGKTSLELWQAPALSCAERHLAQSTIG